MKFSARAAVVALTACAGLGAAVQTTAAAAVNPDRLEAAEQAAAATRVPFDLPLGSAVQSVTGDASSAGLHGSMSGLPIVPPSPVVKESHSLIPDPLLPALGSPPATPDLNLVAPVVGGDGSLQPDGLVMSLPQAPMKAVGAAASVGQPITATGGDEVVDLTRLQPSVTSPQVETAPSGFISLDQRTMNRPLDRTVDEFLTTAAATAQVLAQR
ncbi:hypothetical protein ACEZCY_17300 [Streptacidiphilus sp. N1-12]|uniref:GLTT repeat-containing protein n=2 Tax=Streptacidiphilus alkalitolerans TaxID=3342712 RepID=A0ABV6VA44_9ACTN